MEAVVTGVRESSLDPCSSENSPDEHQREEEEECHEQFDHYRVHDAVHDGRMPEKKVRRRAGDAVWQMGRAWRLFGGPYIY